MRLFVVVIAVLQVAVGTYVQMPYPNPAGVTFIDRYQYQRPISYSDDSQFNGYSYPEPAFNARIDTHHVGYARAQVPTTASVPVVNHVPTVSHIPVTRIASHSGVIEQHVDVVKPALSTRKFEVRRPAIQKHFYDIEQHVVVRPAGSAVVELDSPTSRLQKGPAVIRPLDHNSQFIGHHLISNNHGQFHLAIPSNINFAQFPSTVDPSLISSPTTPFGDEDSEVVDNFDYLNQPETNQETPQDTLSGSSETVDAEPSNELLPNEPQTTIEPPTSTDSGNYDQSNSSESFPSTPSVDSSSNSGSEDSSNGDMPSNSSFNGYPSHSDSVPASNPFSSYLPSIPAVGSYHLIGSPWNDISSHGSHFSSYQIFHLSPGNYVSNDSPLNVPSNESPSEGAQSQDSSSGDYPSNNAPFEGYPANNAQFEGYPASGPPVETSPETSPPSNNQPLTEPTPSDYPITQIPLNNNIEESAPNSPSTESSTTDNPSVEISSKPSGLYLPAEENKNEAIDVKLPSQEGIRKRTQQKFDVFKSTPTVIPSVRLTPEQSLENQNRLLKLVTGRGGITEIIYGTDPNVDSSIIHKESRELPFGYRLSPLRSRVLSATELKEPQDSQKSNSGERVSTRRVVVNSPIETLEEVDVHEPVNQVARVTVRTPTVIKTAHVDHLQVHGTTPVLKRTLVPAVVETHVPVFQKTVTSRLRYF